MAPVDDRGGTLYADGRAIEGYPVAFRSSDVSVLTVSPAGLLRSAGPLGTSIISVTAGDVTAEVEATVVPGPSTLLVTPEDAERLALAGAEGSITLVLRNPLDAENVAAPASAPRTAAKLTSWTSAAKGLRNPFAAGLPSSLVEFVY